MGVVVPLRLPGPEDAAYEAEVRELCRLARIPDEADRYIRRRVPRADVLSDCILAVFGRRVPWEEARRYREMLGPAGSARRSLPLYAEPHGARRPPARPECLPALITALTEAAAAIGVAAESAPSGEPSEPN